MAARFEDLVAIGRVVKPQGRKGELAVEPFSDRPQRFPTLRRAFVAGPGGSAREVAVTRVWPHKGRFVVKLLGVDSIDAAEAFRGMELRIPEADLEALPKGSYYHHQLVGLRVEDEQGCALGTVKGVLEAGGEAPVLEIRSEAGGEVLLPLAEEFVRVVDLEGGRLVIARRDAVEVGRA